MSEKTEVASGLTPADIEAVIKHEHYYSPGGSTLTVCVLSLKNGAKVVGQNYGSINPEKQDWEKGEKAARAVAVEKVWELEGYLLRERIYAGD